MAKKPETAAIDPAKLLEQARATAEENLNAVKANFEKTQSVLTSMQKEAEESLETAQAQSGKISMALIDTVRTNTEASLKHAEKLVGVKSVAELIEIQTSFLRAQAEHAMETSKSLQSLYQQAGTEMMEDAKSATEKTMAQMKKFS